MMLRRALLEKDWVAMATPPKGGMIPAVHDAVFDRLACPSHDGGLDLLELDGAIHEACRKQERARTPKSRERWEMVADVLTRGRMDARYSHRGWRRAQMEMRRKPPDGGGGEGLRLVWSRDTDARARVA